MTNENRVFRAPCAECEARAIAAVAGTEGLLAQASGCRHNRVAVTVIAWNGKVSSWSIWPAESNEDFARGAAAQVAGLDDAMKQAIAENADGGEFH